MEEVVDGVFYGGGVAPVVLGREEYEGGVGLDEEGPGSRVCVSVLRVGCYLRGYAWFVVERQVQGVEVDGDEGRGGGTRERPGGVAGGDEGCDLGTHAGLAGGADDEAN